MKSSGRLASPFSKLSRKIFPFSNLLENFQERVVRPLVGPLVVKFFFYAFLQNYLPLHLLKATQECVEDPFWANHSSQKIYLFHIFVCICTHSFCALCAHIFNQKSQYGLPIASEDAKVNQY